MKELAKNFLDIFRGDDIGLKLATFICMVAVGLTIWVCILLPIIGVIFAVCALIVAFIWCVSKVYDHFDDLS